VGEEKEMQQRQQNLTIVGLQWGDEGKGKLVDYLADRYDGVARFNGGSNAGHTVVIGDRKFVFHLVPSGVIQGKRLFIGAGVALDPVILNEELALLGKNLLKANLLVDERCTLVSPMEKELDAFLESLRGAAALGTTRRGIGPAYAMRALRLTPRAGDLFGAFDTTPASRYYSSLGLRSEKQGEWFDLARNTLHGLVGDAAAEIDEICDGGGSVIFEGSQGSLLDVLHGSYPHVTSSQTLASSMPGCLGISAKRIGKVLGVAKCYTTRVGAGPFPTEIEGPLGEQIRGLGAEYGATTGRPRRVGWLDLVALSYAAKINGLDEIAITKADVMAGVKELRVCVAYKHEGSETTDFQRSIGHLGRVEPVYEELGSLLGAGFEGDIPAAVRRLVEFLESRLRVRVGIVSYGQDRSNTIEL
jgi:adenylosuccinate synthase